MSDKKTGKGKRTVAPTEPKQQHLVRKADVQEHMDARTKSRIKALFESKELAARLAATSDPKKVAAILQDVANRATEDIMAEWNRMVRLDFGPLRKRKGLSIVREKKESGEDASK